MQSDAQSDMQSDAQSDMQSDHPFTVAELEQWLTEQELGGPKWLNSKENAAIMATTLPSQPHENAALAKRDVLQYLYKDTSKIVSTIG